jgi:hypothetical protein
MYTGTENQMQWCTTGGRYKDFTTCWSHLSVVCLFYGNCLGVYIGSVASHSPKYSAEASVMCDSGHPCDESLHLQPEEQEQ